MNGLEERLERVRERIAASVAGSRRPEGSVRLVAVSKTFPPEAVVAAAQLGLDVFGENRVQEAAAKIPVVAPQVSRPVSWHLIGHLQTNKAKMAAGLFDLIHSVDSSDLARKLDAAAGAIGVRQQILLQVNVAGETQKSGVDPAELESLVAFVTQCPHLELRGLMTLPPYDPDSERVRPHFQRLRALGEQVRSWAGPGYPGELSMGMSEDFEIAIAEGATLLRIGRALFGERIS